MSEIYEFDVTVRVRKRVWCSGPTDRETARGVIKSMLEGGMIGCIVKRGEDGHPIESIIDNTFTVDDITE